MNEHPIQAARRRFNEGYRANMGRTYDLMVEAQEQQQDERPADAADVPQPDPAEYGAAVLPLSAEQYAALEIDGVEPVDDALTGDFDALDGDDDGVAA